MGLLNNLRAGRSDAEVTRVLALLRQYPDVLHVETNHVRFLPEALAEFARREVELLVVNGGDGTLQHVLTEVLSNPAFARLRKIAPLRGGRTNMTALDLGTTRDPVKALAGILEAARTDSLSTRVRQRPVLRVRSLARDEIQYGMFFGGGLIRRAIEFTHRIFDGRNHGVWGVGLVTGTLLTRLFAKPTDGMLTPDKLRLRVDEREIEGSEFYLAFATSLSRLFLRIEPFWGTGAGDVRFTAVRSTAQRLAQNSVGILRGRPGPGVCSENGYESHNADRVQIGMDCGFTIDGEVFEPRPDELVTLESDHRIELLRA